MNLISYFDNFWAGQLKILETIVNNKLKIIANNKNLTTMENQNFTATISVSQAPDEVFNCITNVSKWWSKDYEGSSSKLNHEFIICHPGAHYSKQKLIEVLPGRKMVWQVIESKLDWLQNDRQEWTGTKMIFDITKKDGRTALRFTHEGLLPGKECYNKCEGGWNKVIKDWLFNYITTGKSI